MSNPLLDAIFGRNSGLDITGAIKQQGQNQLNSIDAFGGLMQQPPASKIAQSPNNRKPFQRLDEWYQANPMARPGEYDPMGVKAERRRQVRYGTQDTQDRNRLLQEQLWGNFLGKTNDMMSGRGQGNYQIGLAPANVGENNSPGQGGVNPLQGQLDQLLRMLAPAMEPEVSLEGFQPSPGQQPMQATGGRVPQQQQAAQGPMFGPGLPGATAKDGWTMGGVGVEKPTPILEQLQQNGGLAAAFNPPKPMPQQTQPRGGTNPLLDYWMNSKMGGSPDPSLVQGYNFPVDHQSALSWYDQNQTPQYTPDPTLETAFAGSQFANFQPQYTVDPNVQAGFNRQAPQQGKNFVNQDISQVLMQLIRAMNPNIQFP